MKGQKPMAEIVKESVETSNVGPKESVTIETKAVASSHQTIEYLVYFFFGVIEILLVFRFVLRLLGANLTSPFVNFIYGLTGLFIFPFVGIFRRGVAQGIETSSVLEPETVMAFIVYVVLAWGIVQLIRIMSGEKQEE